jgi:hypothetical protein
LSFYQNFITQNTRDGGNVQFSLDTGKTWNVLGKFGDFTWYNQPYVYSLGLGVDGFSGTSNGWQLAFWQGGFVDDGAVMFRFHFASDFAVTDQGWAIDDFCFEPITGNCTIGVGEGFSAEDWSIYPVPANTDVIIQRGNSTDEWKVTIWAAAGVLLDEFVWTEGSKEALIDVSNYSNGVYWVKIESAHGNVTKPIVIQR